MAVGQAAGAHNYHNNWAGVLVRRHIRITSSDYVHQICDDVLEALADIVVEMLIKHNNQNMILVLLLSSAHTPRERDA